MIQAVADKIIVEVMKRSKTVGGLILPENSAEPQAYGKILSCGEIISEGTDLKEGDVLVFHPGAGMDMLMDKNILKTLKYEEVYGILQDESIKEGLEPLIFGVPTPSLIKPV